MKMDRSQARLRRLGEQRTDDVVPGTPAERIGMVWPLTREMALLSRRVDPDRPMQRHVTRLIRRKAERPSQSQA